MAGAKKQSGDAGAMRLVIERSALLAALGHAQSIVEKKQIMPILGNVLLDASADAGSGSGTGGLAITTTNLDMQIVLRVPAQVDAPGAISAPAHGLKDIVSRMPDGCQIGLEVVDTGSGSGTGGKKLRVTAGRSKIHLLTLPTADFPVLPVEDAETFELPSPALRRLIDRTRFAMHSNDAFANLCGIYLYRADDGHAGAAATDKHRIARQMVAIEGGCPALPGTILPAKVVTQLRRLIEDDEGALRLTIGPRRIVAADPAGRWELTAKLLEDATYPPVDRAIAVANAEVPLTIDAGELAEAVTRVAGIMVGKQRTLLWSQGKDVLTLSARDVEMGDAVEELPCEYDGPEHVYGFNPKYVSEQLQSIDGAIRFFSSEPMAPTRIEIASDPDATFVLAQLPVGGQ